MPKQAAAPVGAADTAEPAEQGAVDEEFLCYVPLLGQQSQLGWDMIVI
jgi:hypothetical protein